MEKDLLIVDFWVLIVLVQATPVAQAKQACHPERSKGSWFLQL
jgi:hypothetical protein